MTLILVFYSHPFFSSVIKQPVINIYKNIFKEQKLDLGRFYLLRFLFVFFDVHYFIVSLCGRFAFISSCFLFFSFNWNLFFLSVGFLINIIKRQR